MPFPGGVNFTRIELFFKGGDKVWSNILWYTTVAAFPGNWDIAASAAAWEAGITPAFADCMANTNNYIGLNYLVHNAGLARSIDTYTVTQGTQSAGTAVPDDVACVVSRLTTTPGKSGRGRLYVSGLPSTFITENRLNATGFGSFTALVGLLKGPFTNQTMLWSPANFSKKTVAFHAATDFITEPLLGTQRRRKARR
jgi:hypothetical protein